MDDEVWIEIVIGDPSRGPRSPHCGMSDALMSRCNRLDPVYWFKFTEPWPIRDGHDEWKALVGEHGDVTLCFLLPQSDIDFA